MATLNFDTLAPAQVISLANYYADPLFTVGDSVGSYIPPGILNGIGAYSLNNSTVRLLVSHQLGATDGYKYSLSNGLQLSGSRISYFDVDKATSTIVGAGLAFDTIINRGSVNVSVANQLEFSGLQRLASATLLEANQFGAGIGLADRIYFTGESTYGGSVFALDPATKILYAVPWLGRAAWNNITEINTGTTNKVAFLIGDDRGPAPLRLYVGDKDPNGSFLNRNGLSQGRMYVWVADDPNNATDPIESDPRDFNGTNNDTVGKFVEINLYNPALASTIPLAQNVLGYDSLGLATQAQSDKLAADVKAFLFTRPQDLATNPSDGTQAVLTSRGRESIFGGADTYGVTYKIDVDFNNIDTGNISARIDILFDGNATTVTSVRNPNGVDWAEDGNIYINEDRAATASLFAGTSNQESSIWKLDPSNANPSSTLTRFAQIDRSALPATQTDSSPADIGNWDTTGILDVSSLFGQQPGTKLVLNVQAHSLRDGTIITATDIDANGDGTKTRQENLVEGGQLLFLSFPPPPSLSISAASSTIQEGNIGSSLVSFTISRTGSLAETSQVNWTVVGSGANPATGVDFAGGQLPSGLAVFGAGQGTISLSLSVIGDRILEADDGFSIELSNPVGAQLSSSTSSTGLIEILNDDAAPQTYTFTSSSNSVDEGSLLNIGVITTNIAAGTSLYWRTSGTNITVSDFTSGGLDGEVVIGSDGRASFTRIIAADTLVDSNELMEIKFYSDASRTQQVGNTLSVTIQEPSVGLSTDGNDIIIGTAAGELISGIPSASTLRGRGSRDELTGAGGDDIFALGDASGAYYDDGISSNRGTTDMAIIKDFTTGDRIQLWGDASKYSLVSALFSGVRGVRIDLNPTSPAALSEAIGFVQAASPSSLSLTNSSQFLYAMV